MAPGGGMRPQPNYAGGPTSAFKVNYFSGLTAVDFRGGERLRGRGGRLTSVGEILLMAPDGTLSVINELDDKPAYEKLTYKEPETLGGPAVAPPGPAGRPRKGLDGMMDDGGAAKKKPPKKAVNPKPTK